MIPFIEVLDHLEGCLAKVCGEKLTSRESHKTLDLFFFAGIFKFLQGMSIGKAGDYQLSAISLWG